MNPTSALSSLQTRAGHFCRRTWAFAQNPHKTTDVRCERSVNNSRLAKQEIMFLVAKSLHANTQVA
jgi:hypothetical protein